MADNGLDDGSARRLALPEVSNPQPYVPPTTTIPGDTTPYGGVELYNSKTGKWVPAPTSNSSSLMIPLVCVGVALIAVVMMKNK